MMVAMDSMSMLDQLPWSPGVLPLPSKVAKSESPSSILRIPRDDRCDPTSKHSNVSSGNSAQPKSSDGVQPKNSPDQPELQLINPPSGQAKGHTNSDDVVVVEDSRSMED